MPQLPTDAEVWEGETHDIAAPSDATVNPSTLRAWIATGRVRAAYRISDHARMNAEDRSFPTGSAYKEIVVAVEYDDLHGWLYTLTESALYVEVPGQTWQTPVRLDLAPLLVAGESMADVKLWPADSRAMVLTSKRVIVVQGTPSTSLTVQSYTKELLSNSTLIDTQVNGSINGLGARNYRALRVARDAVTNKVMAYVTAEMTAYPICQRPIPRLLLVGDLDSPSYAAPTFDLDPTTGVLFSFWNPVACPPPSVSCTCSGSSYTFSQYCIRDIDIGVTANRTYAYCACGPASNLVRLDVTGGTTTTPPLTVIVAAGLDLLKVKVDPGNAERVFTVDLFDFYVVDFSGGTPVIGSCSTSYGITSGVVPGPLDSAIVHTTVGGGTRLEAWTVSYGTPDYQARIVDWSTNTPSVIAGFWSANHCDGGVALPPDAIYMPNFGGVARFSPTGPNGTWIKTSYQPATSSTVPGVGPTEQIWLERDVAAPNDHRVFTPSALGGFDEFRVDNTTKDLGPCTRWRLTLPYGPFSTNVYGNDLVVARINNKPFVIVDLTDFTNLIGGLVAWGLNPSGRWVPVAAVAGTTIVPNTADNTFTIHLTQDLGNTHAVVSHKYGYFFVDLRGLANPTPTMTGLTSVIDTSRNYWGVATVKHRLYVCSASGSSSEVDVFAWDDLTGATGAPLQPPVTAGSGVPFSGGLRARYAMYNSTTGCGALHVALNNGYVVEFLQPATSAGFSNLVYSNYWKGNYDGPVQDCRVYDFGFGPRILAVKDAECFALAIATMLTCP
jgi:hypothetical protein